MNRFPFPFHNELPFYKAAVIIVGNGGYFRYFANSYTLSFVRSAAF